MAIFPVLASTLCPNALGDFISNKYKVAGDVACRLVRTGLNHTYLLTDSEATYSLRVYCCDWRSREDIEDEIALLLKLSTNGVNVSYPFSDLEGNFIQTINGPEGVRYAVLFSFAEGGKVRVMDTATCYLVGATMAAIHKLTVNRHNGRVVYNPQNLLYQAYDYTASFFSDDLPEMQYLKSQCDDVSAQWRNLAGRDFKNGIVHLDIWYDNMAINKKGEVTLFDFDNCGNGPLVLDVAYFCKQLFHIEADKTQCEVKMKSFLEGYTSVIHLSEEERAFIPAAAVAIFIFYLGEQCRRLDWSNIFLSENYLKLLYMPKIKTWRDYYQSTP